MGFPGRLQAWLGRSRGSPQDRHSTENEELEQKIADEQLMTDKYLKE